MKKSLLFLVPALLCLTSCQEFKVGIDGGSHRSGLDKSVSGQGSNDAADSFKLYGGDVIQTDDLTSLELTFGNFTDNLSDISDISILNSYVIASEDNIFTTIEAPKYVGTKEEQGLFVGADSRYADGYITFSFNKDIKCVAITATPYYYIDTSWNGDERIVDEEVGISVNGSLYVPLASSLDKDTNEVKETVCKYDVTNKAEDKNKVSLRVKQRRAFLKKITLYY